MAMIKIDEEHLKAIRHYMREICIVVLAYAVVNLYHEVMNLRDKSEIEKLEQIKFWKDAYMTTSKFNKYLQTRDTITVQP